MKICKQIMMAAAIISFTVSAFGGQPVIAISRSPILAHFGGSVGKTVGLDGALRERMLVKVVGTTK